MATLPPELIMDILLYLPVKSLCRFRCVSKQWSAMISDPRFIKLHLIRTPRQKIFLVEKSLYSIDLDSFLNTKSYEKLKVHPVKLDVLKENPAEYWKDIFGSNGLFCLRDEDDYNEAFFIYNPFTRESKKIFYPQPIHMDPWSPLVGFGYAESIDDYKFVTVMSTEILHIFSLKNNSWKTIEIDFPITNRFGTSREGIALNGAIHWRSEGVIHVFDLVEEKFKTLSLPDSIPSFFSNWLNGKILLKNLSDNYLSLKYDGKFWIMKEYGVKESWTRVEIANNLYKYKESSLLFWKDNGMMLWISEFNKKIILSYQTGGKIFKEVEIEEIHSIFKRLNVGANVYIESPVLLN